MGAPTSPVWYFAYGSNMQTATFRDRRGVPFSRALPARVSGWRIVFDKPPVVPGGAAVANIVADPAAVVFGVLYEITPEDLAHVELTEGVLIGNYHRVEVKAESLGAAVLATTAASVASDLHDSTRVPSDRYMGCVIAGAEEHRLPSAYISYLRGVPVCPETEGVRELLDGVFRGLRPRS
jgi:hypothetical protein